jgi:hypothetical protein
MHAVKDETCDALELVQKYYILYTLCTQSVSSVSLSVLKTIKKNNAPKLLRYSQFPRLFHIQALQTGN